MTGFLRVLTVTILGLALTACEPPPVNRDATKPLTTVAQVDLTRYAWLAIAAALATITLKTGAWLLTGSVGLLSDAAESIVNLVAAIVALIALRIAALPPDDNHQFGHAKAEYFSAAVEGVMIFVAAVVIIVTSVQRFLDPQPLENVGVGLAVSVVASVLNGVVSFILIRAGRAHRSITLTADGRHLLTDVWTSVGVVLGVLAVALTGWLRLDPLIALVVAANIIYTGVKLLRQSGLGLLDTALPQADMQVVHQALTPFAQQGIQFHAFRSRMAAQHRFVSMHVLVPGEWTVLRGHEYLEMIEAE